MYRILIAYLCVLISINQILASKAVSKKDVNDNRGQTPFFLQDPYDQTCLGPDGFTVCDETTLWVLTARAGKKDTYSLVSLLSPNSYGKCLTKKSAGLLGWLGFTTDRLSLGPCEKNDAKSWSFDFVDKTHVKLSLNGKCLVRGKKKYKNSVSLQSCESKNSKGQFLPMVYHPTAIHQAGFFLKAADGKCFDGSKFTTCEGSTSYVSKLMWGVGIKYAWGKAQRYFFNLNVNERGPGNCLVSAGGNKLEKDDCNKSGSLGWGLSQGKLTFQDGKYCVARLVDNTAVLASCIEASEYITMDVPTYYTNEELANLVKNQVLLPY